MIENKDGSFGNIEEVESLIAKLNPDVLKDAKAIHFGTQEELSQKKEEEDRALTLQSLYTDVYSLTEKVNKILVHLGIDDKAEIMVVSKI